MAINKRIIDESLTNLEKLALAKVSANTTPLAPGDHDFDITVRVSGSLRKGEDYERTPTASVPLKQALALFVRYCGITRKAALSALTKAMTEALDTGTQVDMEVVNTAEKMVMDSLEEMPKVNVSGATTVQHLQVEKVNAIVVVEAGDIDIPIKARN